MGLIIAGIDGSASLAAIIGCRIAPLLTEVIDELGNLA